MAIIYSYPEIPEVQGGDLLLISDTGAPNKPTRSVDIDDLAAYIGTVVGVVQNLQSVLTVGNTYVNANGYGTFTLNDTANDDGSITFVNPNEGWGYQISAEEGINITDGSGTNLMSIYSSGLSIRNGAQIMNIGTNALTATRNVYFPDASGTIALTSDIPSPGPSGSGTTNYTARWTSASALGIGALYDNGTDVGIGINGTYANPPQRLTVVSDDDIQPVAQFKNIGNGGGLFVRTDSTTRPLLELFSGSSYRFVVKGTGDVGIGTTSPSQKLEVAGNIQVNGSNDSADGLHLKDRTFVAFSDASSVVSRFRSSAAGVFQFQDGSYNTNIVLNTNGNSYLNGGNVGIGTTSPSNVLTIETDSNAKGIDFDAGGTRLGSIERMTIGSAVSIGLEGANGRPVSINNNHDSQVLIANGGGNVGVGTTSPSAKLHILGTTTLPSAGSSGGAAVFGNSSSTAYGLVLGTETSGKSYIQSQRNDGTATTYSLLIQPNGGNVGIGTTNPSEKLDVVGRIRGERFRTTTGGSASFAAYYFLGDSDTGTFQPANNTFGITTAGVERVRITDSGNIGIGTTSPVKKLEVNGTFKATGDASIDGTGNLFIRNQSATGSGIIFIDNVWQGGIEHISGNLYFRAGGQVDRMTIKTGGNVGIGTTSPVTKLHLYDNTATVGLSIQADNASNSDINLGDEDDINIGRIQYSHSTDSMQFQTNNAERIRINNAGNVGIGTTSPNAKLNVNGNVKIEGENELYFGGSGSVPNWEIKASGSDLVINDTGSNVGSVLFNNDEGVVLPRLTTTEINAISLPNTGLTVYNTTLNTLCFYNGSSWQKVSHANM